VTTRKRAVYRVNVTRERDAWLADVPDVAGAHTFARSLSVLQRSVREVIVLMTDRPEDAQDDFDLDVRYEIGDSSAAVAAARRARVEAKQAERASAAAIRQAVAVGATRGAVSDQPAGSAGGAGWCSRAARSAR
jgi:hypothetical protein